MTRPTRSGGCCPPSVTAERASRNLQMAATRRQTGVPHRSGKLWPSCQRASIHRPTNSQRKSGRPDGDSSRHALRSRGHTAGPSQLSIGSDIVLVMGGVVSSRTLRSPDLPCDGSCEVQTYRATRLQAVIRVHVELRRLCRMDGDRRAVSALGAQGLRS